MTAGLDRIGSAVSWIRVMSEEAISRKPHAPQGREARRATGGGGIRVNRRPDPIWTARDTQRAPILQETPTNTHFW